MTRPYTAPQRFRPYAGNDELEWLEYNGGHSGTGRFGAVEEPRVMTHGRRYRGRR